MRTALYIVFGVTLSAVVVGLVAWKFWGILARSEDPAKLIGKAVVSVVLVLVGLKLAGMGGSVALVIIACGLVMGLLWAPNLGAMLASPLSGLYDGGSEESPAAAFYSIAVAKRKQGKYGEAVAEVRKQLTRFPGDYQGMMLLAEIYAEDLHDSVRAFETVEELLAGPVLMPRQTAHALNRMADWHIKWGRDPAAASQTLERAAKLLPDTEYAQLARQRIAHMASPELLQELAEPHRILMRKFPEKVGLEREGQAVLIEQSPEEKASQYVRHLTEHPYDNEARENLARLYAEHYKRLDLAAGELEQLIQAPNQLDKHVVGWLNSLADYQILLSPDPQLIRRTLQRIVDGFPNTAAAEMARHRMAYLNLELRKTSKSQAVKLGSYEQNIGLKGSRRTT